MISKLDNILNTLKEELEEKITSTNTNYNSNIAEVVRGYCTWSEVVNKPYVWFTVREDGVDEDMFADTGTDQLMSIDILLECIMDSDGLGNHDNMHTMLRDVKYFLKYDFKYADLTYVLKIRPTEGGTASPICGFQIDIKILYEEEL